MLRIGITGGIGAGKSTISRIFEVIGIPVYNADSRAKWLMANDKQLKNLIIGVFGRESYQGEELNRSFLADAVFNSNELIGKLNTMVHPVVAIDFNEWCLTKNTKYVLKEAALLFETGSYHELDYTILVEAPEDNRIIRIKKRDTQRSTEQIKSIILKQIDVNEAQLLADFSICNDGIQLLIPQVISIHKKIIK